MSGLDVQIDVTIDPLFGENAYTVYRRAGGPCWIIDPGLPPHAAQIVAHVRDHALDPQAIVLTHAHGDHIAGIDDVRSALGPLPIYLAKEEWPALTDPAENLSCGFGMGITVANDDLRDLPAGSKLELDGTAWVVSDTSGHSPGGRSFYCAAAKLVIVGDALFEGSIGRVDFHHSHGPQLLANIGAHLLSLPDDTRVLSGHGEETTIGHERRTNPFLASLR